MAASTSLKTHSMIPFFVAFLLVFAPSKEVLRLKRANAYLKRINKPAVKTIQSPDGDVIHCVLSHLQPAFDLPELKGKKPLDPPERPRSNETRETVAESYQLWTDSGESCPEGTVPIRRTTVNDVLRASSVQRFGRKLRRPVRRDSTGNGHEHAVVFVNGDQYFGAKASLNVWSPQVTSENEFSLSQIWVISGSFGNDLNTIEAGWQVSPDLYGDGYPRFFTYWTAIRYWLDGLEGPKTWKLVAGIWIGTPGGILASVFVQSPEKSRKHGAIWWGNSEL
ncbi:PROTEIN putative (DUF239)-RELATED-RELATED [Salix purpurea]|uniref:PROTEIN putative (DUF239)-RELATED-RELATED n=1 Tax=Salix purpurea TaxID=77065 RepID=A0A9Q0W4Y0_SALPP|nr:PROTEIN putative (DUF239)-RELATED-RELATED [Salix purpurea]